jgi:predicted nucleic acid-binding protein
MTVQAVLDTNVLLYAIDTRPEHARKRTQARELIGTVDWGLSTQIAQEFYVNVLKGKVAAMTPAQASLALDRWLERECAGMDAATIQQAVRLHQRYQISYWDAAVVAAAIALGATVLYSEDLNHGQVYEGVRVKNPFAQSSTT